GGVGGGAAEHGDLVVALRAQGRHGEVDVRGVGGSRGEDHRLAGAGDGAQQRDVPDLERGDLVHLGAEILEQVDGGGVEGAGERDHAVLPGPGEDRLVPLPGGVGLLVEVVEVAAAPQAVAVGDAEGGTVGVDGDRVRRVGLELDRGGAGLRD